jgi:hypothetical protein
MVFDDATSGYYNSEQLTVTQGCFCSQTGDNGRGFVDISHSARFPSFRLQNMAAPRELNIEKHEHEG